MTDDEVARTAELIREINRTHALIVVEHDMQFIRMIARTVTVMHQGAVLVEDTSTGSCTNSRCATSISASRRRADADAPAQRPISAPATWPHPASSTASSVQVAAGEFVGILGP